MCSSDLNRDSGAALDWDKQLYSLTEYQDIVKDVYLDLLPQFESLLHEQIDIYANHIRQSVALDSIRWNYAENQAGHYSSFDNNIRYIKFFLAKRISFLNRQFGLESFQYEDTLGNIHVVTCVAENETIEISVKDGTFLKIEELPDYNKEKYSGWIYEWDLAPVSEYLPVYEDITLRLSPK